MTTITALPPAPSRTDPDTFSSKSDALLGALDGFVTETNTVVTEVNALAAAMGSLASGAATSIPYTFSTTTADADPGAGILRLDNATQNAATTIRVDLVGSDGSTWTDLLATFDDSTSTIKGFIMLQKATDATKWLLFSVSALASPSGYKNITVANVASSAASPFANSDALLLKFQRNGDKGDTGAAGADGAPGSTAITRSARTSNTILGTSDAGKLIDITSGTFTQTFTAAATLGDGWWCYIRNSGTGDITLDPNSSEQIDGLTSYVMYPGETRLVQCTGTAFYSLVLSGFYREFTATGTFTKPPGYRMFEGLLWGGGGSGGSSSGNYVATTTITIGAGGIAVTAGNGNTGNTSSFGSLLNAYGAGGGQANQAAISDLSSGGGGGWNGAGSTGAGGGDVQSGSNPQVFAGGAASSGASAASISTASTSVYGGGSGGSCSSNSPYIGAGAKSLYGGGGGGAHLGCGRRHDGHE